MKEKNSVLKDDPSQGLEEFLHLLKDLEESGGKKKPISGILRGPFYSQAVYGGVVRIGIENR